MPILLLSSNWCESPFSVLYVPLCTVYYSDYLMNGGQIVPSDANYVHLVHVPLYVAIAHSLFESLICPANVTTVSKIKKV